MNQTVCHFTVTAKQNDLKYTYHLSMGKWQLSSWKVLKFVQLQTSHHMTLKLCIPVNAYLAHQTVRVWKAVDPWSSMG